VLPGGPAELSELGESFNAMLKIRNQAEAALKKAYRAERRAADELREVDAMRNAFLMAISHELRTPLTSVVGYSTLLSESMDGLPEEEIKVSIEAICSQSRRLERLLLDLLDVERLERGIVEPHLSETDVAQLVMRVIEQSSANERIRADIKGPVVANIDPALVERIIENLVFNAIKHTPQSSRIWVRARRVNGDVRISVEDSGGGVPDDIKEAIFEPFTQGEIKKHSPGTGIGLSLVAQFAKLHGGRAWVEDRKGGGAAFRVELPAKPQPKRVAAKPKRRAA
jgi:signal transduction histidine kinase